MNFRGSFIKEIDDLGEKTFPYAYEAQKGFEERQKVFDGISSVIKELAVQNGVVLDEKTLLCLLAEFGYQLGEVHGYFWDAAENFQPALVRAGIIRSKNYRFKVHDSVPDRHIWVRKSSS